MDKQLAHMVVHTTEWFKADTKLTEAERGRLPLLHDETTALAHLRAEAEANVRTMMLGEIPALRRIDLQYEHQMLTAGRALAVERKRRAEGKATLAELESAEADYTAATEAYAGARTMARKLETLAFKEAVASEISGFLSVMGLRRAAAVVEAVWQSAEAYAAFAKHHYREGVLHLISAATYIACAAKAGGGGGGGAAAGGYGGGGYGGGGEGGAERGYMVPRGAPAAGGPGGPNVTIHVHGGVVGARDLAAFVGQVSREVQRGTIRLISSGSLAMPTPRT